jgi:hypothetical protein
MRTMPVHMEAESEAAPLYKDSRPIGAEFWIALVLGAGATLGFTLGISALVTLVVQGISPATKISECPANYADFGPEALFYEGCSDVSSEWYATYNAPPANVTHEVSGWFGTVEWTRATLRALDLTRAVTVESEDAPLVYPSPAFRPFWLQPIDAVQIVLLVVTLLGALRPIATSTVRATEVLSDRVVVTWVGGSRTEVPLCALADGDPKKHEAAGLPPVRGGALSLRTSELVEFTPSKASGKSTRLTDGKRHDVRVEPKNKAAFLEALASARAGAPKREHHFADEMPPLTVPSGADSLAYTPTHRVGYWVRVPPMLALYWAVVNYGFRIFVYALQELVQPGRPKLENEFALAVLAVRVETFVFLGLVLAFGTAQFYHGLPSQVVLREDALVMRLDRATALACGMAQPSTSLVVPARHVVAAVHNSEQDCVERAMRLPFEEAGGIYVKARLFYVHTQGKNKIVVERKVAKDASEGRDVKVGEKEAFYPPAEQKAAFVERLRNHASSEVATSEVTT